MASNIALQPTISLVEPGAPGFSKVSLVLPEDMPFEQWEDLMGRLERVNGSAMWWIGDGVRHAENHYGDKYKTWQDQTGFAYQTIADAKWVAGSFPEFSRRRENLYWNHHRNVAGLCAEDADHLLEQAEQNKWSVQHLRGEVIKLQRGIRAGEIAYASGAGLGPWSRLYADPPWQYGDTRRTIGGAEGQYETLPLEQIETFLTDHQIEVHDDAVLFLWATVPLLREGLAVMKAWDFEYTSQRTWDKVVGNPGSYYVIRTEILLMGVRGKFPPPSDTSQPNIVSVARGEHSAKPDIFRKDIESMYPAFGANNSLELFARKTAAKWTGLVSGKFVTAE